MFLTVDPSLILINLLLLKVRTQPITITCFPVSGSSNKALTLSLFTTYFYLMAIKQAAKKRYFMVFIKD